MDISENKSNFLVFDIEEDTLTQIKSFFPYKFQPIIEGLKYLDYSLKPNNYLKEDWLWLLWKVEKSIGH